MIADQILIGELTKDRKQIIKSNILLFLAYGFEDLEAIAIRDVFGWTQFRKNLKKALVSSTGFHPIIESRFGLKLEPDLPFPNLSSLNPVTL